MESTPVCGVDIRKDTDEPLDAPLLYKEIPAGRTPQEQSGNGTPSKLALTTEAKLLFPKYLDIKSGGTATLSIPAKRNPNSKKGAISDVNENRASKYVVIYCIILMEKALQLV
jgi:hypothetical protein|tara:strand:+ start:427 stop:765 length:339 start_codon:yes stop_codon:yes gene_type:complete